MSLVIIALNLNHYDYEQMYIKMSHDCTFSY